MMILGNGIDIIEIKRISAALNRRPRLLLHIFTKAEQEYFASREHAPQTIAGCFAAKEAVVKALGIGFGKVKPNDVELTWDNLGKPIASVKNYSDIVFLTSISHSKEYAVASVIAIKE